MVVIEKICGILGKVVVLGQSGCIWAKVVVFWQSVCYLAKSLFSGNVVVIGDSCCIRKR